MVVSFSSWESVGSPWRDRISLAILDLQEKGIIQMLYDKWWKSPGLTCIRDEMKNKDGKASALGLDNIGGVFVVLLFGLALALITAVGEFFWNSRKSTKATRVNIDQFIDVHHHVRSVGYFNLLTNFLVAQNCHELFIS